MTATQLRRDALFSPSSPSGLQDGSERFQIGGLDGGLVEVMEPGLIVNTPDHFGQPGGNIAKTDLQRFDH